MKVDNKVLKLQIWDTAGQERYKSISAAYMRNTHGIVAVYDITQKSSFINLESRIRDFLKYSH